ncbi:hypothetical protein ACQ4PT_029616 [Festuca glaucescens]
MPPPPPPPAAPAPTLPAELIEEIFLRLPPDEPEWLVRASLASKHWLGLLTGPAFRTRYREFHGAPPMLGFLYTSIPGSSITERFVSTTKFGTRARDMKDWGVCCLDYDAWDCRHGRVLLCNIHLTPNALVVWDPMTGDWNWLVAPENYHWQQVAVLCAVSGCDHRACHDGPFRLVSVTLDEENGCCVAYERVSSLETGEQSDPDRHLTHPWNIMSYGLDHLVDDVDIEPMPPVLIEDALHFMLVYLHDDSVAILKYDLGSKCLSLIDAPLVETDIACATILMGTDDGSLGFAHVDGLTLNLWSRQMASDGVPAWTQRVFINLKELLPIQNPKQSLIIPIGSVEGSDIIFLNSLDLGIYEINLKSLQWKKIWKAEKFRALFPYMSFHNLPEKRELL